MHINMIQSASLRALIRAFRTTKTEDQDITQSPGADRYTRAARREKD